MTAVDAELPTVARALLALTAVLLLLAAARWAMVRHGLTGAAAAPAAGGLALVASLNLDPRHRLVIVRHGGAELLLAVGPGGVARIDGPPRAEAPSAAPWVGP